MVIVDSSGFMQLSSTLSTRDNQELFRMTKKALSHKLDTTFITIDILNRADGLKLWDMIIDEYKPTPKDTLELDDLKQSFLQLSKFGNENDNTYLERFNQTIKTMEHYKITPSQQQQVIIFLKGLKDRRLTTPILELRQKPQSCIYSDWIKSRNLRHTLERARNYCNLVQQYTPASAPPTSPPGQPHYVAPSPTTTTPPSSMSAPNIDELKRQFKAELLAATRPQDVIFEWRNKHRRGCVFHPTQTHKFLKCRFTESICRDCNFQTDLNTAIFNSQESTRRILAERAQTGTTADTDPPNAQRPPQELSARRTTAPSQIPPTSLNNQYQSPPTPPTNHYQELQSDDSNSSLNSINQRLDPYSTVFNCKHTSNPNYPPSILNPPKSFKQVRFSQSTTTDESSNRENYN